jgi:hypothetical protein
MAAAGNQKDGTEALITTTIDALRRLIAAPRAGGGGNLAELGAFGDGALTLLTRMPNKKDVVGLAIRSFCILTAPLSRGGSANFDAYVAATSTLENPAILVDGGLTFWSKRLLNDDGTSQNAIINNLKLIQNPKDQIRLFDITGNEGRPFTHPIDLVAVGSSIYASLVATTLHAHFGSGAYDMTIKKVKDAAAAIGARLAIHSRDQAQAYSQADALKVENLFFICTATLTTEGNALSWNVCADV